MGEGPLMKEFRKGINPAIKIGPSNGSYLHKNLEKLTWFLGQDFKSNPVLFHNLWENKNRPVRGRTMPQDSL
jgi:hypothetical protein